MDYFFYNTDARAIIEQPRPRFRVLIDQGFAAVGGDRQRFGKQLDQFAEDDILLMYENGVGVVAIGRVQERWDRVSHNKPLYYTAAEMEQLTGGAYEYRIAVDWFFDLSHSPIGVAEVRKRLGYTPRGAVRRIVEQRAEVARMIEELRAARSFLPEEIAEPTLYVEGASRQVSVNAYERNPEARRRCIEHYGTKCCICGVSFGAVYGAEAEGYIHVHHIRPLSEVGGEYVVDPVEDLRPVCPNCHAVLHLGGRCRTIDEVRQLLEQQRHA
jgi:5-methylcytosine-specific restriction endonuclease McrA